MFVVNDLLDAILLGCFFFGLVFSGLSLFLGVADLGIGHNGGPHGHLGDIAHHGHHGHVGHDVNDGLSPVSVGTILGFLTWFGGVAYIFRNGLGVFAGISLLAGVIGGLTGGYVIFWLLRKVHSQQAGLLIAADDYMPGTIGRVTSSIRAGGTGEIVYERRGVRQVSAARSPGGIAIPRGTEIVVLQHRAGIADVEPWSTYVGDEFDELDSPSDDLSSERAISSRSTGG
jgi:hypothetical protein